MARNLRLKIAPSDTMYIHDVNPAVLEQFEKEVGNVKVAQNVRELAEKSVRLAILPTNTTHTHVMNTYCSIYDLSWQRKLFH